MKPGIKEAFRYMAVSACAALRRVKTYRDRFDR